jgi:hypothetical protein
MMFKTQYILFFLFLFLGVNLNAQNETYKIERSDEGREEFVMPQGDIYLAPFSDRLFRCDFSKEMMSENQMEFPALRDSLRAYLNHAIQTKLTDKSQTVVNPSVFPEFEQNKQFEAYKTGINYAYKPLPEPEPEKKSLIKGKSKPVNAKSGGARIEQGQIKSEREQGRKFMDAEIKSEDFLRLLTVLHQTQYLITINQLEIVYAVPNQLDIQHERFKRQIAVHYSVFDLNGKKLSAGLAETQADGKMNSLVFYRDSVFPIIADQIAASISTSSEEE